MRQRLALAAALLGDPPVLVLDEPTASLDAAARGEFHALLGELNTPERCLVITSHRAEEVAALADRVLVLSQGRMVAGGPAADPLATPGLAPALRLVVAADELEVALALLAEKGFQARRNGRGLLVAVVPGDRAAPLAALFGAGIRVRDVATEEGPWTRA
jgi:ABC-type multidrug transport system ATPase subunit